MTFHGEPTKEELLREKIETDLSDERYMEAQDMKQEQCTHEDLDGTGNVFFHAGSGSSYIYDEMQCTICNAIVYEEYRFTDIVDELPNGSIKL